MRGGVTLPSRKEYIMPKYIDVELTTGQTVKVYSPPVTKLSDTLRVQYPDPDPPIVEEETATGSKVRMQIVTDPEYLREKERVENLRNEKLNELTLLSALRDEQPPDGFYDEFRYLAELADPDWKPREGNYGAHLDYIEWVLLANVLDQTKVQRALAELSGIDLDAVSAIEESFRGNVEGETTQALAE